MKKIFRIAGLELKNIFYSPIGWLVLIIFTIQAGHKFTDLLQNYQQVLYMGRTLDRLTSIIFDGNGYGLFPTMAETLYLYIPLLTMGLMSRETSSGSIKLLLSSPVRNREIILGKFAAMMVIGLILLSVLFLLVLTGAYAVVSMDFPLVLSGLLGLYLLICAYSAIGLFLSCLTTYQVVAAICTLVVLAFLNYIGRIGQNFDIVRDLTWFLSLSGRINFFVAGLLTTRDILYFFIITGLFITLSIFKLRAAREAAPLWIKARRYILLTAGVLSLIFISSRAALTGYYDVTATNVMTLTENSQTVIRKMDKPLKITTYVNLLDQYGLYDGLPEQRNEDKARFEMYRRFLPELSMDYVYYYDSPADEYIYKQNPGLDDEKLAEKVADTRDLDMDDFLSPAKIRSVIDLKGEGNQFVRQVEYDGKMSWLRFYYDQQKFPSEQEITAAFKRLIVKVPVIAFLTGNNERSILKKGDKALQSFTIENHFRNSLINQGFDVTELAAGSTIPDTVAVLVLADPTTALDSSALQKIREYISKGGNLLIAGEPGRQELINPLCRTLGIQLSKGELVQKSKDYAPDMLFALLTDSAARIDRSFKNLLADNRKITMPGAVALELSDSKSVNNSQYGDSLRFNIRPLVVSDGQLSWNKIGPIDPVVEKLTYQPEQGDSKSVFPVMASLTRNINNKEQRIIVSGDADFMSNKELERWQTGNSVLLTGILRWLNNGVFPIDSPRPPAPDNKLRVDKNAISFLSIVFTYVIPSLIGIWAAILLIRRKRK